MVKSGFWKRVVTPAARFEEDKCSADILKSKDKDGRDTVDSLTRHGFDYWEYVNKQHQRRHP